MKNQNPAEIHSKLGIVLGANIKSAVYVSVWFSVFIAGSTYHQSAPCVGFLLETTMKTTLHQLKFGPQTIEIDFTNHTYVDVPTNRFPVVRISASHFICLGAIY